jgi:hypothetical protein
LDNIQTGEPTISNIWTSEDNFSEFAFVEGTHGWPKGNPVRGFVDLLVGREGRLILELMDKVFFSGY